MPSNPAYYQLSTAFNKTPKGWWNRFIKDRKKKQLVASLVGIYVILTGLVGYSVFLSQDTAKASEVPFVSTSIRLLEEKEFNIGDKIETALTVQNTSTTDSIDSYTLDMISTRDSVQWNQVKVSNSVAEKQALKVGTSSFRLPVLAPGERLEFLVGGILQDNNFDYLTIMGKIRFDNREGAQQALTNKIFTKLHSLKSFTGNLLTLGNERSEFASDEEFNLTLGFTSTEENAIAPVTSGKLYVTKKDTQTVTFSADCQLGDQGNCVSTLKNVEPGSYTALYLDEANSIYSEIFNFSVTGQAGTFKPASTSTLDFPFGASSVNGVVPVIAKKVVSLNVNPSGEACTFDVLKDKKVLKSFKAAVGPERSCGMSIPASEIAQGNGIYTVQLSGTDLQQEVSFLAKSPSLINLQNKTTLLKTGSSVQLEAVDIKDSNNILLNNQKVTLVIWHPKTGDYREATNIDGNALSVQNGVFTVTIPSDYFTRSGYYNVYMKVEDGQQSDFVGLAFDDKDIGFVKSGVLVDDYGNLKIGQTFTLSLTGVVDKNGNALSEGDCGVNLYQVNSGPVGINVQGTIKDGVCQVQVPGGKLTRSGPVLATFNGPDIGRQINQSRQFMVLPGNVDSLGELNFEYEPVRKSYANTVILGPVTDKFGNLTNVFDFKLKVFPKDLTDPVGEFNLSVSDGFAQMLMPASVFQYDNLTFKLYDRDGNELASRDVDPVTTDEKLILPVFPNEVVSDKNVTATYSGVSATEPVQCKLTYIRTLQQAQEEKADVNLEKGKCQFDWNLTELRDSPRALLKLSVMDTTFSTVIKNESGEPTNLFVITPQVRITPQDEIQPALLSSPVVDKNGLPVESAVMRMEVNGKTDEVEVINGFARLDLFAGRFGSKDIRTILDHKFLDLSVDAKVSATSIAKTNDVTIYLGNKDIATTAEKFTMQKASNHVYTGGKEIFEFKTDACSVLQLSDKVAKTDVRTHWQGGTCYVQVEGQGGKYDLLFEDNGFTVGKYQFSAVDQKDEVIWCQAKPCSIQVITSSNSKIEAIVYDGDNQYKFETDSLDNLVKIQQNGLNPLKKYLVEIRFKDLSGEDVSVFKEVMGENLVQ